MVLGNPCRSGHATAQSRVHAHLVHCFIGSVAGVDSVTLAADQSDWDCRNNRLAWMALQEDDMLDRVATAVARYGSDRVAVLVGTSTGSIGASEEGYRRLDGDRLPADLRRPAIHSLHSLGAFLSDALAIRVEGIGVWADGIADWATLRSILADETDMQPSASPTSQRPPATVLASGERRRAPGSVLLALEAAGQAVRMSGRRAADLTSVFACTHGDAPIMDYMCRTLAESPRELSPTRFHNSVHNAAAGYWTIATGCHAASSAVCAWNSSFGAGLLEAVTLALADDQPVLLTACDVPGNGPLGEQIASTSRFACAMVLVPARTAAACAQLQLQLTPSAGSSSPQHACLEAIAASNVSGAAAPLLEALAAPSGQALRLEVAPGLGLKIETVEVSPHA